MDKPPRLIEIPQSDNYDDSGTDWPPCIVCGRPITAKRVKYLRVVEGGGYAVLPEFQNEYDGDNGDLGLYPVGPNCLRKHPQLKPYVQMAEVAIDEVEQ